jgi:hypothetical protein
MLELLVKGAASKDIAKSLGYKDGTMRVYLHALYKRIGVKNKTSAVSWYLGLSQQQQVASNGGVAVNNEILSAEETFGDIAMRSSLAEALGAMTMFVGGYGRMWEVTARLKGELGVPGLEAKRSRSRRLWNAFLKGDFVYAKTLHDDGIAAKLFIESPADCLLLATMLLIGGYTMAAENTVAMLTKKKNGSIGLTAGEFTMLKALSDATIRASNDGIGCLHHIAAESNTAPVLKQLALGALYYLYKSRHDTDRALALANCVWAEAEIVRQHLQAMGERPLFKEANLPEPPARATKSLVSYMEKISAR